ncbi:Hsp20/alpha crystallin family protein [Pseudomonadota bacterium]
MVNLTKKDGESGQDDGEGEESGRPITSLKDVASLLDMFLHDTSDEGVRPLGKVRWPNLSEHPAFEGRIPKVDVIDRGDELVVMAELPGVKKEDLDVTLNEHNVSIRASTRYEAKDEEGDYHHCEISHGEFSRVIRMPVEIDAEKARAMFVDGMLELIIPKSGGSKRHTVKIE